MAPDDAPDEIYALANERAEARRAREWDTADRLKAEIEAAGWKVVDAGTLFSLEPLAPPDVAEDGRVRYGSSASVPSRLEEAPVGTASVVIVIEDDAVAAGRTIRSIVDGSPDGTQLVVVANAPAPEHEDALAALDAADPGAPGVMTEVVWTAARLGYAAALNAGIRRAVAPVVIVVRPGVVPVGDLVGATVAALEDDRVAVAGPVGLVTADLRQFDVAPPDATDLDAISGDAIGFRRSDYVERGPLDEQFAVPDYLDAWWSLVLRDLGEEDGMDAEPRLAVRPTGVTLEPAAEVPPTSRADKATRKAFYRYLKYFATRRDLLAGAAGAEVRARLRGVG